MTERKTYRPTRTHWLYFELDGLTRRVKLRRGLTYAVTTEGYPFYELRRLVRQDILTSATPAARMLASSEAVPLNQVEGTGEDGRIIKTDVQTFIDNR